MQLNCSFCGRDADQVETLFKGLKQENRPEVFICGDCVAMCAKLLPADFEPSTFTLPKRDRAKKDDTDAQ